MKNRHVLLLTLSFVFITMDYFTQGCSQCKMLAEQGAEVDESSFGSTINTGILYLMVIPYLILLFLFRERIFRILKGLLKK